MRRIRIVVLSMGVLLTLRAASHGGVLGVAENYNAFIFQDMTINQNGDPDGSSQGAIAVGGNATLLDYSVATSLNDGTNLVVGQGLSFQGDPVNGNTIGGSAISGGSIAMDNGGTTGDVTANGNFSGTGGPLDNGTIYHLGTYTNGGPNTYNTVQLNSPVPLPVDFGNAENDLINTSASLSQMTDTGLTVATLDPLTGLYDLTFTGTQPGQNIFSIDADDLQNAESINIILPAGEFAVINVTPGSNGTVIPNLPVGASTNDYDPTDVLWNFNAFTDISVYDAFNGSVLAPSANISFESGLSPTVGINGTVVANILTGDGEFSLSSDPFDHTVNFAPLSASIYAGLVLLTGLGIARRLVHHRSI